MTKALVLPAAQLFQAALLIPSLTDTDISAITHVRIAVRGLADFIISVLLFLYTGVNLRVSIKTERLDLLPQKN